LNPDIRKKILKIAYRVRRECENIQSNNSDCFPPDLGGLCAISSVKLHKELEKSGIKTEIAITKTHCFLLFKGKYVIDITATQFGFKERVLIIPLSKILNIDFDNYNIKHLTNNRSDTRKYLIQNRWADTNLPYISDTL